MGTSTSYVGSRSRPWEQARQLAALDDVAVLPAVLEAIANDDPAVDEPVVELAEMVRSNPTEDPFDRQELGIAPIPAENQPSVQRLRSRPLSRMAARPTLEAVSQGGSAIAAAYGFRRRDGTLLEEFGLDLNAMEGLDHYERVDHLLSVVIGDGSDPDLAVLERTLAGPLLRVCDTDKHEPDVSETLISFVSEHVTQIAITEFIADKTLRDDQLESVEERVRLEMTHACMSTDIGTIDRITDTALRRTTEVLLKQARILTEHVGRDVS